MEDRNLPFKAEDAAIHIWFAQQHAGVVRQIAGREIVRTVNDDVVRRKQL